MGACYGGTGVVERSCAVARGRGKDINKEDRIVDGLDLSDENSAQATARIHQALSHKIKSFTHKNIFWGSGRLW